MTTPKLVDKVDSGALIDLATIKNHLVIERCDDDELLLDVYLPVAADFVEGATGLQMMAEQWQVKMPLPQEGAPVVVSFGRPTTIVEIKYNHQVNGETVLDPSTYVVKETLPCMSSAIFKDESWRDDVDSSDATPITVDYYNGYTHDTLPKTLLHAMLLLIGDAYENREAVVVGQGVVVQATGAVKRLLGLYDFRHM